MSMSPRKVCMEHTTRFACSPRLAPTAQSLGNRSRSGISLIEVLISMFVILFGLMGVAALFPVGNFYAQKGEKFDLGTTLGLAALDELQTRGMLRPEKWLYADVPDGANFGQWFLYPENNKMGLFSVELRDDPEKPHPGHAFVLDPRGSAAAIDVDLTEREAFPLWNWRAGKANRDIFVPWRDAMKEAGVAAGRNWPVRRLTFHNKINPASTNAIPLPARLAEAIFTLRDDLKSDQPKEADQPAIQRWDVNDQGTPAKNDDVLLTRQFQGNYSWLATIVPSSAAALSSIQLTDPNYGQYDYEVSVVVFRKRDILPSAESERLVDARLLPGGEIEMFLQGNKDPVILDPAFQDILSSDWIAVMGVHPTTGLFLMKWYRMLSLDRETSKNTVAGLTKGQYLRRAMLSGPDWPMSLVDQQIQAINLKVALLPGAISVITKPMKLASDSLWEME